MGSPSNNAEREQLLADIMTLAAPLLATISYDDKEAVATYIGIALTFLPEVAGVEIRQDDLKVMLFKAYKAFTEAPESYDTRSAAARIGRSLDFDRKVELLRDLLRMTGMTPTARNGMAAQRIDAYCGDLGVIWDHEDGTFSENLWGG